MKMPDFTQEKWEKWLKDKEFAEERVEHLEDELDKALDEQEKLSHAAEECKAERDAERRLRVQAESDARRAKAAADQAAAAAAAASRSLKMGEKQAGGGGSKDGENQDLRVEIQQLKAKKHGLETQVDALGLDHERLASLLATVEKDKKAASAESKDLRAIVAGLENEKKDLMAELQTKSSEWETLVADRDAAREEASRLDTQNQRLGDELDRMAGKKDSRGKGSSISSAELNEAIKAREAAEERLGLSEAQVAALQAELRTAKEEVASLETEAELKAGAAREGLAAADAQTQAVTEEASKLRAELSALQQEALGSSAEQEEVIRTLRAQASKGQTSREEAEEKASALESRVGTLNVELTESKRMCMELETKVASLGTVDGVPRSKGNDEEGTTDQLLEMMALVKDAETAKAEALEKLEAKTRDVDELEKRISLADGDEANGVREVVEDKSAENGRIVALEEELSDLHAMLDNVASERDAALNDLRRAGGADVRGADDGAARAAEEEAEGLRRECEELREKLRELETEQGDDATSGAIDDKRLQVLEDQVERLSEEHTRQSENWRGISMQMESEKEELSQELISAKLQVAQLSMEVDGLKLRHRQEVIAASEAHAQALENAMSPPQSVTSMASQTSPGSPLSHPSPSPSPVSPHTLEL